MKKFIALLVFSTVFFITVQAQVGRVVKIDSTSLTNPSGKFGLNKLDNQLLFNDGYSLKNVPVTLTKTATIDFGQGTDSTAVDSTVSVPGARLGDEVVLGVPHASVTATGSYFAWVSAANVVTIRLTTKKTENPASGVFHISVIKYRQWH